MPDTKTRLATAPSPSSPTPERGSSVLIIAGTTGEATEAAVDFLLSEKSLLQMKETLHLKSLKRFEVLLRTMRLDGTPLSSQIIAGRS